MNRRTCQFISFTLALVSLFTVISAAAIPAPAPALRSAPVRTAGFLSDLINSLLKKNTEKEDEKQPALTENTYVSPVDFDVLKVQNPEIYAWIDIEGTDVSYPILRSKTDNAYYLTHDSLKKKSSKGAIFTEDYNDLEFNDPTTLIYGHTTKDGSLFGKLQENYSSPEYFNAHRTIKIYLPDREYTYKVFAAVPFGNEHILYYFNFKKESDFKSFYKEVFNTRSLAGNVDKSVEIGMDDHVIVLSTCIASDRSKRFLVLAVRETDNK